LPHRILRESNRGTKQKRNSRSTNHKRIVYTVGMTNELGYIRSEW
jgi:hypothetical protein